MAIGTAAAIGLGLAGVGSAVGAISGNKAAKNAANAQRDASAANTALARDIYGQNKAVLNPYVQRGNVAGETMNALLGLGGTVPQAANTNTANALAQYQGANPDTSGVRTMRGPTGWNALDNALEQSGYFKNNPAPAPATQAPATGGTPGQTPQQAAQNAFDIFRNSTGYQFRLGEGLDAVNSNAFGAGIGQSGAALKALQEYGQNFASNEFGNYMGYLGNQQGVGLGAGSALAGVGQNYVNTISNNNNNAAAAAGNAALAQRNPWANALGTLGGGILGGL